MYLVQELCTGGELLDHILKAKHFSEKEASAIMLKLAQILSYLHSNQVQFFDASKNLSNFKPKN